MMSYGDKPRERLSRRHGGADFNWDDISVFLVLARHRSLSGAARELAVNHSTIGRRIRTLESSLETKLFERTRHGFLLTDDGDRLLREAEGIETHANNIAAQFRGETAHVTGTVRVATMEGLGSLFLASRFSKLYERYPSVRVELVTASHWVNLSKREADVLISFPKPRGQRIATEKIGEFSLFLYASEDYLAKNGMPKSVHDLDKHVFIDYIEELVAISAVRWLSDVIRVSNAVFRSTSLVAQYHAATAGIGIAMLPTFVAQTDPRLRQVLPQQVVVKRDLWLSVHNDLEHIARVRQVVQFLKDLISENAAYLTGDEPWV
ncbi:MAG: LysR family transcriptional regulator [Proteobacteria bacterium]|nr:LysR family transcriptional regulator [Pseudomonadota bacterium]